MTISGLLGVVVGYAIKKIFATLTRLYIASLTHLTSKGLTTVNCDKLTTLLEDGSTSLKGMWRVCGRFGRFIVDRSLLFW